MFHSILKSQRIASAFAGVAMLQASAFLAAQEPAKKTNAIIIDGGEVKFKDRYAKDKNDKKVTAIQQSFQRELMKVRVSERKKVSPEAKQRAMNAYADMNVRMSYIVDNARDVAKMDINSYNKMIYGAGSKHNVTTNELRIANGQLPKSGDPYVDMANDSITDQIKRIFASNPNKKFTVIEIFARFASVATSNATPEAKNLFYNRLADINFHLQALVNAGYLKKEEVRVLEKIAESDELELYKLYNSYAFSVR